MGALSIIRDGQCRSGRSIGAKARYLWMGMVIMISLLLGRRIWRMDVWTRACGRSDMTAGPKSQESEHRPQHGAGGRQSGQRSMLGDRAGNRGHLRHRGSGFGSDKLPASLETPGPKVAERPVS